MVILLPTKLTPGIRYYNIMRCRHHTCVLLYTAGNPLGSIVPVRYLSEKSIRNDMFPSLLCPQHRTYILLLYISRDS